MGGQICSRQDVRVFWGPLGDLKRRMHTCDEANITTSATRRGELGSVGILPRQSDEVGDLSDLQLC